MSKKAAKKIPAKKKAEPKASPDQFQYVTCPECGHDQSDMGKNVLCEECENATMPWYDDKGVLHE